MFRFFFQLNDESEGLINTFHFSTDKFFLSLKDDSHVFLETTFEELIEDIERTNLRNKEEIKEVVTKVYQSQQSDFQTFLWKVSAAFRRHLAWLQRGGHNPTPFGAGYVFNPTDPKKGKKLNSMSEASDSNTERDA